MRLRPALSGSKRSTLRHEEGKQLLFVEHEGGTRVGRDLRERIPSSPSQTNPSMSWWTAKSVGSDAKRNSRPCLTRVSVNTPIVASTPLPTKLAVAENHMSYLEPACPSLRRGAACGFSQKRAPAVMSLNIRCRPMTATSGTSG
jgi:hypothetical protein